MTQDPPPSEEATTREMSDPPEDVPPPPSREEVARFRATKGNNFAASAAMVKDILDADSTGHPIVDPPGNRSIEDDDDGNSDVSELPPPISPSEAPLTADFFTTSARRKKRFKHSP
jgi:hypothetical protein